MSQLPTYPDPDDPALRDLAAFSTAHRAYRAALEAAPLDMITAPWRPDPRVTRIVRVPAGSFHGPPRPRPRPPVTRGDATARALGPVTSAVAVQLVRRRRMRTPVTVTRATVVPGPWSATIGRTADSPWTPVRYSAVGPVVMLPGTRPVPATVWQERIMSAPTVSGWTEELPPVVVDPSGVPLTAVRAQQGRLRCEVCGADTGGRLTHLRCTTADHGRTVEATMAERRSGAAVVRSADRTARAVRSWRIMGGAVRQRAERRAPVVELRADGTVGPPSDTVRRFICADCGTEVVEPRRRGRPSTRCPGCRATSRRHR